ncbi:hypothetical protein CKO09_07635 [Chromatium weissei]|nr:hypothetical protein [Chromatium weissei]
MSRKTLIILSILLCSAVIYWNTDLDAAQRQRCQLEKVVDGDTLRVSCRGKSVSVRLHCIDAPEKSQLPWGARSTDALRRLAPTQLELDIIDTDRYGRIVADVYMGGADHRMLNLEQVRNGNAAVYARYCDDNRFIRAEREAKVARRGIWSHSGEQQTPWTYRHRR